jgi:hypothetical protein
MQETPFDWTMTGLMITYMAIASFASRRLRRTSLILMFMLGTLHLPATDEKSLEGIRETQVLARPNRSTNLTEL